MALSINQGKLTLYSKEPTRAGADEYGHQLNYTDDYMRDIDIGQDFKDYFSFSEQNKQNISRISGMNDAISHPQGEHRGGGNVDIYTHLKFWGSLIEGHTDKKDPFLDFDMYYGISQVVENITYTAKEIDTKVLEAFKKGWNDGWDADYLVANELKVEQIVMPNQFYVQLKRSKYDGPGIDTLEIPEKQGGSSLGTLMSFELKFDNNNKQSQVYLHTSNLGGKAEYSSEILANDGMHAYKEGIKAAINQGDVLYWYADETNKRIGIQWHYINNLLESTDEDYKKISEIKYTYLQPTINTQTTINNYNSSNIEFKIVPQITGYIYDSKKKESVNKTIDFGNYENDYITLSADKPYQQGYAEGLKDTIYNGAQNWFYNKSDGLGVQWYYTNRYLKDNDDDYKKTSEVKYHPLYISVVDYDATYDKDNRTYTISYTPQLSTSVYSADIKQEKWQDFTFDSITQTIYTNQEGEAYTDGWNHGYDDGYIAGWQKAVSYLKAELTHEGKDDASGNVIATASIKDDSYIKKVDNKSEKLSGSFDRDSAYLSFNKGSDDHYASWDSNNQINAGSGENHYLTGTWYTGITAKLNGNHTYGSLTWYEED